MARLGEGSDEELWLAMALRAVNQSNGGSKLMRLLSWQAFEVSHSRCVSTSTLPPTAQRDAVIDLELVLAKIKALSGLKGSVNVTTCKEWLRSAFGSRGEAAASSLGALSKSRNSAAHPRMQQLLVEIDLMVKDADNTRKDSDDDNRQGVGGDEPGSSVQATTEAEAVTTTDGGSGKAKGKGKRKAKPKTATEVGSEGEKLAKGVEAAPATSSPPELPSSGKFSRAIAKVPPKVKAFPMVAVMTLVQVQKAISASLAGEPPTTASGMQWYVELRAREDELKG